MPAQNKIMISLQLHAGTKEVRQNTTKAEEKNSATLEKPWNKISNSLQVSTSMPNVRSCFLVQPRNFFKDGNGKEESFIYDIYAPFFKGWFSLET